MTAGPRARLRRACNASAGKLACGMVVAAALALAGCGGSGGSSSTSTAQSEASSASSHLGAPAVTGGSQESQQFAGRSGQRKFQALANTICSTVRTGAPPAAPRSSKPAALRKYAAAAAKANQRTIVSLQRLGAPKSLRKQQERLLSSLQQLQSAYVQVSSGNSGKANSMRQSIAIAEAQAGSDALASGAPACAPHLPGVAAPPPKSGKGKGKH